ncbi:hypothetical protein [Streptomyces sp. NBC_01481]|uniref:hypothetical protein n=1 Tax=Streptomyces sp. NBC_01481 TaxID=2975869 RepID=UPI00225C3CCF|nr:hypothetical protein [Streptomyces sp. NBC_01481]MCX4587129.1 hypothetical protein [Streptomyces sp. NBC_01481]
MDRERTDLIRSTPGTMPPGGSTALRSGIRPQAGAVRTASDDTDILRLLSGAEFLADLFELVRSGRFKYKGMGTLPHPDADGTYPAKLIFRGEGLTMVLKPGGEWQTLLEAGAGMDLRIRML